MHDKGYHKADGRFRQKRQTSFCVELFSWVRRKHQRPSSITNANHFACSKLGDGFVVDALGGIKTHHNVDELRVAVCCPKRDF